MAVLLFSCSNLSGLCLWCFMLLLTSPSLSPSLLLLRWWRYVVVFLVFFVKMLWSSSWMALVLAFVAVVVVAVGALVVVGVVVAVLVFVCVCGCDSR